MASRTNMQCLLKIDTHSGGWEKCLSKMLKKIRGAKYSLDVQEGTLLVAGKLDPTKVLNRLKKAGKAAEILWVSTGAAEIVYFEDPNLYSNHYGRYNSDYSYTSNGYGAGYYPSSSSSYGHPHQLPNPHHYPYSGHGYAGFY